MITSSESLTKIVKDVVRNVQIFDIHTHLFPPSFIQLFRCGIDEILTYHYLIPELFRSSTIVPQDFWRIPKKDQAELVWNNLFIRNSPISEAAIGVLTIIKRLGINPNSSLNEIRNHFDDLISKGLVQYKNRILSLSNVKKIVMTNDPFDQIESRYWENYENTNCVFESALRLDGLLENEATIIRFMGRNYDIRKEMKPLFQEFMNIYNPIYISFSLPDIAKNNDSKVTFLREKILPIAEEFNAPIALMIGVRRGVNPSLLTAGDGVGKFDITQLESICRDYPNNKFLVTFLSRENQYEFVVLSRKFANLMPFGSWWFLNNPHDNREILDTRLSLLGLTFCPQHSDARVLEQLIYKWDHFREVLIDVLINKYNRLVLLGREVTRETISEDVHLLLFDNFRNFMRK